MAQLTIQIDDELALRIHAATQAAGTTTSEWIADAARQRIQAQWPQFVRDLAGAWPDFPTAEEIRSDAGPDLMRERL
jgi:hypothetical protein